MLSNYFNSKRNKISFFILLFLVLGITFLYFMPKTSPKEPLSNYRFTIDKEVLGNKDDLVSFSIFPHTRVHGILSYKGVIKGGYFFEGNILINILDINKKVLKNSNAVAKTEWMTVGPVDFEGNIDFSELPKGFAYFEIKNDNPSDDRGLDKSILIPIVIE